MHEQAGSRENINPLREVSELNARINLLIAMASVTDADLAKKDAELAKKDAELATELAKKAAELALMANELGLKNAHIVRVSKEIASLRRHICQIESSMSWRMTAPLRSAVRMLRKRK